MTLEFFNAQVTRMKDTFGEKAFGVERQRLIYLSVKKLPDGVFEGMVNHFIGNNRYPPLLKDFQGEMTDYEKRKAAEAGTARCSGDPVTILALAAKEATNKEFTGRCMDALRGKVLGTYTREQFYQACDILDEAAALYGKVCGHCNGCGYAMRWEDGYEVMYRCTCAVGRQRPRKAMGPINMEGKREEYEIYELPPEC